MPIILQEGNPEMDPSKLLARLGRGVVDHQPAILSTMAVVGTVATAYLTGKASFQAAKRLQAYEAIIQETMDMVGEPDIHPDMSTKACAKHVWRLYKPAMWAGAGTIACIIMSNRIGTRRAAALAAVYQLSERGYAQYRAKVAEQFGKGKELRMRDDIARDKMKADPPEGKEVLKTHGGSVLCYDAFTGRYFNSDMETLRRSQNDVNHMVNTNNYASLSDYYSKIGLPATSFSDEVGWNIDKLMEIEFSTILTEDGRPCVSIAFPVTPVRGFYRIH
jgi:hypothetical protein